MLTAQYEVRHSFRVRYFEEKAEQPIKKVNKQSIIAKDTCALSMGRLSFNQQHNKIINGAQNVRNYFYLSEEYVEERHGGNETWRALLKATTGQEQHTE